METRLTLRKGIVVAPRQPIQSTNDNAIKGVSIQLGEQPLKFKTFRKNSWGIILENLYNLMPVLV